MFNDETRNLNRLKNILIANFYTVYPSYKLSPVMKTSIDFE